MSRLPIPGGDNGTWGSILNDFLSVSHNTDGTLQTSALKQAGAITSSSLGQANGVASLDGSGLVPSAQLGNTITAPIIDKGGQQYNVKAYGAKGDGTTDDQAAIQSAINAAQTAGGGTVFFPNGQYIVSGTPQVTGTNIILRGTGNATILLGTAAMNPAGTTIGIWVNGASNILIEGLVIDGNFTNIAKNGSFEAASSLWTPVINTYGAQGPKTYIMAGSGIDSTTYLKYRMPIRITNTSSVTVRGCTIQNSVSAGIIADATSVNGCTDIQIVNNRVKLTFDNGIYFHQGVQYATAIGNEVSDTQYNGIASIYCDHILFSNNNIRNAGPSLSDSGGIEIDGSSNCTATGNLIDSCQFYGITAIATQETNITNGANGNQVWASNTNISNNTITNCHANDYPTHNTPGVNVFGANNTTINANMISNCDYGVSMGSQATNTIVVANSILNCTALGVNVGQSADVQGVTIRGNYVARNRSNGLYINGTGALIEDNTILGNGSMGISLSQPPANTGQKIDWVLNNTVIDNADSGVYANAGSGHLAIIKNNIFSNGKQVLFSDASITNGSVTLTSASASFTAADVGRPIVLLNQGTSGVTTTTTIASFTNATTITLTTAAQATESNVSFWIGRGPVYFTDGSTDASTATVLTSPSASFTANDVGKLVTLYSLDNTPRVLWTGTVASFTGATQVVLSGTAGSYPAAAFIINRAQGQQIRAINSPSGGGQIVDLNNTVFGIPELLASGTTTNRVGSFIVGYPSTAVVSYWKFDENTGSSAGDVTATNTGTWNGTLGSQWTAGKIGGGGNFNGTDNFVDFGAGASLNIGAAITISVWLNPASSQVGFAGPLAKGGSYWIEGNAGGTNQYQFFINNGSDQNLGLVQLTSGIWQHFVLTYDGTTATTYLNGSISQTKAVAGTITTTANHLLAGNRTGFSRFYKGGLDEVGLWTRALTPVEVATLYNFGSGVPFGGGAIV